MAASSSSFSCNKTKKKATTSKLPLPSSLRYNKKQKKEGLQGRELTLKLESSCAWVLCQGLVLALAQLLLQTAPGSGDVDLFHSCSKQHSGSGNGDPLCSKRLPSSSDGR